MATHPQDSPRGLFIKQRIGVNSQGGTLAELSTDSTGLVNSKGMKFTGALRVTGTSRTITANSTGWLLGTRYISTNGTGNVST